MPKLYEYLGLVIFFYVNEHEPIHVHAQYENFESKAEFIIANGILKEIIIKNVKGRKPLKSKEKRKFKLLLDKKQQEIIAKWIDYFVYNKPVQFERIQKLK